mmetsp:Transcript_19560/g.35844  ORF Transcript_19560/g.35844 Transcript_19560/m.35844 type:complete len:468 (-) Transcript_19560:1910-3313(-)
MFPSVSFKRSACHLKQFFMDSFKLVNATQIGVIIEGAEFAKEFNYFITIQLEGEGEKRRTDVSARVKNPIFTTAAFYLPLPHERIELNMKLLFGAFILSNREGTSEQGKGQARLLGECVLELGPLTPALTDVRGAGVRQHLRFTRQQDGKTVTVGRFLVNLRLVGEEVMPSIVDETNRSYIHPLPVADPQSDFAWRIRVDFRAALEVPLNVGVLPTTFYTFGWSQYVEQRPGENDMLNSRVVQNNRFPIFNQQELFVNPPSVQAVDGFLWLSLIDKPSNSLVEASSLPMSALRPFHPIHLELFSKKIEQDSRCRMLVSLNVEESLAGTAGENLVDIAIQGVNFDPLPLATSKLMVAMTTNGSPLLELPFIQVDLRGENNLAAEMLKHKKSRVSVFLSPVMNLNMRQTDNPYNAQAIFTVPKSYLRNQLAFWLIVRDEAVQTELLMPLPNSITGHTEVLDEELLTSLQ